MSNKKSTVKTMTKTEFMNQLVNRSAVRRTDCQAVLNFMEEIMEEELRNRGRFSLNGLMMFKTIKKEAVPGGETRINPFTGEQYVTKDKPAKTMVRILPLKKLKQMV